MNRVKVLIPFHDKIDDTDYDFDDIIEVSDERLAEIKEVNINLVEVIGDDTETESEKKTTTRSKKENA
jgi:hypothetical protein